MGLSPERAEAVLSATRVPSGGCAGLTVIAMVRWITAGVCRSVLAALLSLSMVGPCPAQRSSPFEPPTADDRRFVTDSSAGLDTGCTYRSGGPIEFEVEVSRYVGPVGSDGTLLDVTTLVANKVVSAKASLKMPAYDVDYDAAEEEFEPERDLVSFNGHELGHLTGSDGVWKLNSFEIPIEWVKFPARGSGGAPPAPAVNVVRIDIDTANEEERWCTEIDWGLLTFRAMSPIVLIHGNNSDHGFWERRGFKAHLDGLKIPYDDSIDLPTGPIVSNAHELDLKLPPIARSFGVDSLHAVSHSKGGLDFRDWLATYSRGRASDFKFLSHTTLSTPHKGSAGNDLLIAQEQSWFVEGGGVTTDMLSRVVSSNAGTPHLTTFAVAGFNAANVGRLPAGIDYRAVAADADQNGNAEIDITPDEYAGVRGEEAALRTLPTRVSRSITNKVYRILRMAGRVDVVTRSVTVAGVTLKTYRVGVIHPTGGPNDVAVIIDSGSGVGPYVALPPRTGAFGRDHGTIADAGVAAFVLPYIQASEATRGDFR